METVLLFVGSKLVCSTYTVEEKKSNQISVIKIHSNRMIKDLLLDS